MIATSQKFRKKKSNVESFLDVPSITGEHKDERSGVTSNEYVYYILKDISKIENPYYRKSHNTVENVGRILSNKFTKYDMRNIRHDPFKKPYPYWKKRVSSLKQKMKKRGLIKILDEKETYWSLTEKGKDWMKKYEFMRKGGIFI